MDSVGSVQQQPLKAVHVTTAATFMVKSIQVCVCLYVCVFLYLLHNEYHHSTGNNDGTTLGN